jgi:hypothetical protein
MRSLPFTFGDMARLSVSVLLGPLLGALCLLHPGAGRAIEITVEPPQAASASGRNASGYSLRMTGIIDQGDADKVRAALAGLPAAGAQDTGPLPVIELSSMGGSLADGFEIGRLLRKHNVIARVRRQDLCLSSCAFAFLGGNVHRIPSTYPKECNVELGAKIAFHNFALNRYSLQTGTPSDPMTSRLQGFAEARGGAALLVRYAGEIGLPANFAASIMGRPVDEFQYIETVGQFLAFRVCPIGLTRPAIDLPLQAANVCNHSTGWRAATAEFNAAVLPESQVKLLLLQRLQEQMQSSRARGRLAAQLASGAVMRVREEIDRLYEDLRAAGVSLPEIVGPTFEVSRNVDGKRETHCYVSLSPDDPDKFDVAVTGPRGLTEPAVLPPENSRRLFLYDRNLVINPRPH